MFRATGCFGGAGGRCPVQPATIPMRQPSQERENPGLSVFSIRSTSVGWGASETSLWYSLTTALTTEPLSPQRSRHPTSGRRAVAPAQEHTPGSEPQLPSQPPWGGFCCCPDEDAGRGKRRIERDGKNAGLISRLAKTNAPSSRPLSTTERQGEEHLISAETHDVQCKKAAKVGRSSHCQQRSVMKALRKTRKTTTLFINRQTAVAPVKQNSRGNGTGHTTHPLEKLQYRNRLIQ